jgi:DNA-directed RNA polymerase subunit RPC12/RpoP
MRDVYICAHCQSTNLIWRMIDAQCLSCGHRTSMQGEALPREPVFRAGSPTAFERRPA